MCSAYIHAIFDVMPQEQCMHHEDDVQAACTPSRDLTKNRLAFRGKQGNTKLTPSLLKGEPTNADHICLHVVYHAQNPSFHARLCLV